MDPKIGDFSRADVLVEGKTILAVGPNLQAGGADEIDVRGRIVMQGFIDTHHHQFETALRGFLADDKMNMRHGMAPILKMQSLGIEPSLSTDVAPVLHLLEGGARGNASTARVTLALAKPYRSTAALLPRPYFFVPRCLSKNRAISSNASLVSGAPTSR